MSYWLSDGDDDVDVNNDDNDVAVDHVDDDNIVVIVVVDNDNYDALVTMTLVMCNLNNGKKTQSIYKHTHVNPFLPFYVTLVDTPVLELSH